MAKRKRFNQTELLKRLVDVKPVCEKCVIQRTIEELENCHCECHKVNTS